MGLFGSVVSGLFNKSEGNKNRQFQQQMSNSAHQREVADLVKAGLNPMLSAKFGGASTPVGAQASMPISGNDWTDNPVSAIAELTKTKKETEEAESRTGLNEATKELTKENAKVASAKAEQEKIKLKKELADYGEIYGPTGDDASIAGVTSDLHGTIRGPVRLGAKLLDRLIKTVFGFKGSPSSGKGQDSLYKRIKKYVEDNWYEKDPEKLLYQKLMYGMHINKRKYKDEIVPKYKPGEKRPGRGNSHIFDPKGFDLFGYIKKHKRKKKK